MDRQEKKKSLKDRLAEFNAPNSFIIIFCFIVLATILTHLIPAGEYERITNSMGQEIVQADSFHTVEASPIGFMQMFVTIAEAFASSSNIIFCILFAYCFVGAMIEGGVFDAVFGWIIQKLRTRTRLLLPIIMLTFGLMGSVAGLAEETFGMFPVCISLAFAIGYDRIVGSSIVYLAVFTGFASATFNPYTIGVAQAIAGVPIYSGLWYRVICFVVFMSILILYVMRYADRIKEDMSRSLLYDTEKPQALQEEALNAKISPRQKCAAALFLGIMCLIVVGALRWGWYIDEIMGLFVIGFILMGVINRWTPNTIGEKMVSIGSGTLFSMLIIGFSNSVSAILEKGHIIDTIVNYMASWMKNSTGYVSAILMLVIQNILNLFIPSGPGQAAVSMPIMSAFADVTGNTRQLAVLAFQFGDGFSNIFWPIMVCMMCGIIKVPVGKWYKFVTPLFGLMFIAQVALILIAVAIGY